jgi:hypothetical protein
MQLQLIVETDRTVCRKREVEIVHQLGRQSGGPHGVVFALDSRTLIGVSQSDSSAEMVMPEVLPTCAGRTVVRDRTNLSNLVAGPARLGEAQIHDDR